MNLKNKKIENKDLKVNLLDLPQSEFKISIEENVIHSVLKDIKIENNELYIKLSKLKSQRNKKVESVKTDFLRYWKKGKRIPLDCFELFCFLSNKECCKYQGRVYELSSGSSRNSWKINFPLQIDENLFLISEAIRTEGCIMMGKSARSIQGIAIANKDVYLLKEIEKRLNKLNIVNGFSRILNVVIYLPGNEVIKIIDKRSKKELHFNFNKGRLVFLQQVDDYNLEKEYIIYFRDRTENLKVKVSDKNILFTKSNLKGTAYLTLQVYNGVFARFLSYYFKIPYGIGNEKTYTIDFPFDVNKLSHNILKTILNIVISCEGCVFYGKDKADRHIQIKIASKKYLEKLQLMFENLGIDSKMIKASEERLYVLYIRGKNNLSRLFDTVNLIVEYKQDKLNEIVNSYIEYRMPHYHATLNYLTMLKKLEPTNLKNLSKMTNRNYDTLMGVFLRLEKKGYVIKYGREFLGTKTTPWIFKLSDKGLNYINHGHTKK